MLSSTLTSQRTPRPTCTAWAAPGALGTWAWLSTSSPMTTASICSGLSRSWALRSSPFLQPLRRASTAPEIGCRQSSSLRPAQCSGNITSVYYPDRLLGQQARNTSMDKCSYTFQTTNGAFSANRSDLSAVALLPLAKIQHGRCGRPCKPDKRLRIREISLIQTYSPADLSCGDAHHAADPMQLQQSLPQPTAGRRAVTTMLPGMALRESHSARCCKSFTQLQNTSPA